MNSVESMFFVFTIDQKSMGLRLAEVERVLPAAALLDPPQHSPGLSGFLNYRGQVIPVLNLRALLGLPPMVLRPSDRFVIARFCDTSIGLIVDEALGVYATGEMQGFSADLAALNLAPTIEGFIQWSDKLIVIQDLKKFLTSRLTEFISAFQAEHASRGGLN